MQIKDLKCFFSKISPYILTILITVIVHNFITKTSGDTTFVNNFNFGSTLTSITLSLIAIFYTFIDSSEGKAIQNKIIESAEDIKKSSQDLNSINEIVLDFKKELKRTESNIIEKSVSENNNLFKQITKDLPNLKEDKSESKLMISSSLEKFVSTMSLASVMFNYLIVMSYEHNIKINITEVFFDSNKDYNLCLLSVLDMLTSLELVGGKVEEVSIVVDYVDEEFSNLIKKEFQNLKSSFDKTESDSNKLFFTISENIEKYLDSHTQYSSNE